jgi:hypothetical protein
MTVELTQDYLKSILHYDPDTTGTFTWIKPLGRRSRIRVGYVAGYIDSGGYRSIAINGKHYGEHRLAWLYMTGAWPSLEIDHINQNPADNRWRNLRLATQEQNSCNVARHKKNTSGYKGVAWYKQRNKWRARIKVRGKSIHLGLFKSKEFAAWMRDLAAIKYQGEFACMNFPECLI